ncbi:MAG: prephenate dehydratase domain-containing protein, partial [SAR324 cluster bacterium]|nr:prephenate dehydratase domain-containing protein [SAR324 cluster bacterium]
HPQAFEQTSDFQAHHLPEARPVFTDSNIDSGVRFLKEVDQPGFSGAAIVPLSFAEQNPDYLKQSDIQDYLNNTTRFLVVGPGQPEPAFDFTRTKTSVFIECSEDRAGLLYELLSVFNRFHINLCRLESRPSKKVPWMYVFYVDFYNSSETPSCLDALAASPFQFRILGSYDSLD